MTTNQITEIIYAAIWLFFIVMFFLLIIRGKRYNKKIDQSLSQSDRMLVQQAESLNVLKEIRDLLKEKNKNNEH